MVILRLQLRLVVTLALFVREREDEVLFTRDEAALVDVAGVVGVDAGVAGVAGVDGLRSRSLHTCKTNVLYFIGVSFFFLYCQHHLYKTNALNIELSSTQ